MGIENRKTSRHAFRRLLEVEPLRSRRDATQARALNVSLGGLCFEQGAPLSPNDELRIRVHDEAGTKLTLMARVRHATRVGAEIAGIELDPIWLIGVQFVGLTDSQEQQLTELVAEARARERSDVSET